MDAHSDEGAARSLCEVLEAEVVLLFGEAQPAFVPDAGAPSLERLTALNRRLDTLDGDDVPTALCLSGGGIRSATFCLGVIQGLARAGLLKDFHYLSTVSGGGYIGGWLSSWIHRDVGGLDGVVDTLQHESAHPPVTRTPPDFVGPPRPEHRVNRHWPVDRLRAYTNYLSPVWGLSTDALTLVATFVRNLVLNWMVMLPLLAAAVLLPRWQVAMVGVKGVAAGHVTLLAVAALLLVAGAVAYIAADLPGPPLDADQAPRRKPHNHFLTFCMLPLGVAALLLSWAGAWAWQDAETTCNRLFQKPWYWLCGGFSLAGLLLHVAGARVGWWLRPLRGLEAWRATFRGTAYATASLTGVIGGLGLAGFASFSCSHGALLHGSWRDAYAVLAVPALLAVFWATVTLHVAGARRFTTEDDREWWSRASAVSLGFTLAWVVFAWLVICAPGLLLSAPFLRGQAEAGGWVGGGTVLLGVLTSAFGYWSKRGAALKADAETWASRLGVRVLDLAALGFGLLLVVALSLSVSAALAIGDRSLAAELDARRPKFEVALRTEESICVMAAEHASRRTAAQRACPALLPDPPRAPVDSVPAATYRWVLDRSTPLELLGAAAVLAIVGVVVTVFTGVNAFSLHNMYGNRLARAYLGATHRKRRAHWFTGFDPEDNLPMADLMPNGRKRMLHVVNVALNLAQAAGNRLEWQERKAAPFTITPLHCGSPTLGYARTHQYGRKPLPDSSTSPGQSTPAPTGGLTLGRAVAISGAAASPNMGYHTSKIVAFAMSFFNVRLGWWLPNTDPRFRKVWLSDEPDFGLGSVLREAVAGTSSDKSFVYLSDGGHFENLGLYEMVRRRCRRIVLVDATEDPEFLYADLESSVRKIRIDLGVEVRFDDGLPSSDLAKKNGRHHAIGRVLYGQGVEGTIIYLKPVLSGDEPMDVQRYAAAAIEKVKGRRKDVFPHDPTSNQAFDEAQFESYRMLGLFSVQQTFTGDGRWDPQEQPERWTPVIGPMGPAGGPLLAPAGAGGRPEEPAAKEKLGTAVAFPLAMGSSWSTLATTAVLAGSVAVTGTVVLKDSTVTLKEGTTVSLADNTLKLVGERNLPGLDAEQVVALTEAIGKLAAVVHDLGIGDPGRGNGDWRREIARLDEELRRLRDQLKGTPVPPALVTAVERTASAVERVARVQEAARPASAVVTAHDVKTALETLDEVRKAIVNSAPRRNVSGQNP
ncbi:hypothetical protein [Rhizobacter sp. OV335]|uniref:hypothetical protein n=1 Tax=Rhizobacter sp. OV335 TaxID=1500264 RepID=UPI00091ADC3F|nr:hypothetical protein [Rhizobacter sp. OV335]SHN13210.1 Patatin-like phospholipase [Rhizobacter sp. OV335]